MAAGIAGRVLVSAKEERDLEELLDMSVGYLHMRQHACRVPCVLLPCLLIPNAHALRLGVTHRLDSFTSFTSHFAACPLTMHVGVVVLPEASRTCCMCLQYPLLPCLPFEGVPTLPAATGSPWA